MEAERRGLLFACKSLEGWAWLVTDGDRQTASWRRLDGQPWRGGRVKAKCLPLTEAKRIIGVREALSYKWSVLVEGGPDLLAALDLWPDRGVLCALSANSDFQQQQLIAVKEAKVKVLICAHNADKGLRAGARWERQLGGVEWFNLRGCKDLNDYVRSDYA